MVVCASYGDKLDVLVVFFYVHETSYVSVSFVFYWFYQVWKPFFCRPNYVQVYFGVCITHIVVSLLVIEQICSNGGAAPTRGGVNS